MFVFFAGGVFGQIAVMHFECVGAEQHVEMFSAMSVVCSWTASADVTWPMMMICPSHLIITEIKTALFLYSWSKYVFFFPKNENDSFPYWLRLAQTVSTVTGHFTRVISGLSWWRTEQSIISCKPVMSNSFSTRGHIIVLVALKRPHHVKWPFLGVLLF